jgi:hypothetical protein
VVQNKGAWDAGEERVGNYDQRGRRQPCRYALLDFLGPAYTSLSAEKMSKMEEEGAEKWTDEQLAETMMEFSGSPIHLYVD